MLKAISNSKLFFVALGITVALCGMRAFAGPQQDMYTTNQTLERISRTLEKLQKDGLVVKQAWGTKFEVRVEK